MNATPFIARLAAVIVAVVMSASALTVSLDYMKFRRVLRTQEDLVYLFVANDLAGTIEDSMNLGLPLAALQTTEQLIQRRRAAERGTVGITVFDSKGAVLFDTERFREGMQLPHDWAPARPDAQQWKTDLPGAYLVGSRITNNFGQAAGGVVVRYDAVTLDARMNAILLDMLRTALAMLLFTAVVAVAASLLLTRRHRIWFARARVQMGTLSPGAAPWHGPLVPGTEGLMLSALATARSLDDAEEALMRLGTGEAEPARAA